MVARVGPHDDVANLAKHSSVPVINALSNDFHPLQTIADFLTIHEAFSQQGTDVVPGGLKVAWVGDANKEQAKTAKSPGKISEYFVPEEAVKDANVIVTDTWVSMGQEEETQKRLKAFAGYQVTDELAKRGGAKSDWKFMHCLPRHPEEVSDAVMYGPRSLVFQEGENRLWAAIGTQSFLIHTPQLSCY
jgi:ornithine carbamoyltransferase